MPPPLPPSHLPSPLARTEVGLLGRKADQGHGRAGKETEGLRTLQLAVEERMKVESEKSKGASLRQSAAE